MATAALRLTGNIAFNRGNGTVVQMEQVGFPAHVITSGRLDNARLPLEPSFGGNVTVQGHVLPSANVTYDLGSASMRWKDLYLSGNTIVLGNTFIREGLNDSVQLGGNSTTVSAEAFAGNGALLTSLDASKLTSGVVPNARISGAYSGFTTLETSGDLTVGGNLYVLTGNVVEIQTETQITDQLIVTNAGTGPALIVEQTGSEDIATFLDDGNVVVRIHDGGTVSVGGDVASPLGALHVQGNVYASGTMSVAGNVLPAANVTYDLGSASMRWKDLYLSGNTVYLGNTVVSSDDSTGTLVVDGSRTVQTVGRTLAASYSSASSVSYSTASAARPDLVQASVAADTANVVVSTWTTQSSAADNSWFSITWAPELGIFAAVANTGTGNRVMTSPDGANWTTRTTNDNAWNSIAWAPELSLFVAVSYNGTGNRVMTSPNGITWTTRTSAANDVWFAVCWAPEIRLFVAVSENGTVMTSPDGINWTSRTSAANNLWHSVTWAAEAPNGSGGTGLFVAVSRNGSGNRVMTSPDGVTWTSRVNAAENEWESVCWSPDLGIFVAVGQTGMGNRVMTSPDGINWTSRTSATNNGWRSVIWARELGIFVAVANTGTGNRVMTSPDGINWTLRSSAADNGWISVTWAPELGIFCAVAVSGTGNRVMTSANPALRTRIAGATSFVGPATTADGDALVSTRDVRVTYPASTVSSGYSSRSPAKSLFRATTVSAVDVVSTWRAQASAADNEWRGFTWAPELGIFVAVAASGTGNRVMTSPDGINWTTRASAADNSWHSVTWAPELSLFVAVATTGIGNRVMTSPDGITWTARTSAADNFWYSVVWAPELGIFVAVAYSGTGNRVMTSPDGVTWTARNTTGKDNDWLSVVWAPELGIFVAVAYLGGTGNRVMTSPDGINWTLRTSAADNQWRFVTWAPELSLFVAVSYTGTGNRVMTSPDGITWTSRTSAADNQWLSVAWAPELGIFVAVADSGTGNRVMTSPDGINWTARTSAADNNWFGIRWSPELGIFAAVSNTGTGNRVMTSKSALQIASAGEATFKNTVVVPRLGVGTGNPSVPLHVYGNTRINHGMPSGIGLTELRIGTNGLLQGSDAGIRLQATTVTGVFDPLAVIDTYTSGVSGNTPLSIRTLGTERMRIGTDGRVSIGTADPAGYKLRVHDTTEALQVWTKSTNSVGAVYAPDPINGGWNAAASILYLSKSTATNRSINAAGTVNASGADYAEYMTKKSGDDFVVAKGDVVGVDSQGYLTDAYDDAITFVIKSTNPSLVGGDDWGVEDMEHPKPPEPSSPPGDDASEEEVAAHAEAVAAHDAWTAEFEAKRARVDRIAFSGQVPVNVFGATPGDYIVPVRRGNDGGRGISAIAVPDASITFEQYRRAVGRVVKIMDDGRAFAIVKVA
jgi:hypothetical protein